MSRLCLILGLTLLLAACTSVRQAKNAPAESWRMTGKLVLQVLDHVNRETSTTTAIITHNAAIGNMGDVVVRMSSGEIVERVENETRMDVEEIEW